MGQSSSHTVIDAEAAFPTAQLVAAMRAMDAQSASPRIGSNIGGQPDTAAATFADELGFTFLKEMGGDYSSLVQRTMFFDGAIMEALDAGCKQLVILAAGLDARVWRLPRLDPSIKVFEVDVPRAIAYKEQKLAELKPDTQCTRIVVEADLSDPSWTTQLLAAGYDPEQTAFFLIEGLLMYLPQGAPQALLKTVSSIMSSDSTIAGDAFTSPFILWWGRRQLAKYGTKWTFAFRSPRQLAEELTAASFNLQSKSGSAWYTFYVASRS